MGEEGMIRVVDGGGFEEGKEYGLGWYTGCAQAFGEGFGAGIVADGGEGWEAEPGATEALEEGWKGGGAFTAAIFGLERGFEIDLAVKEIAQGGQVRRERLPVLDRLAARRAITNCPAIPERLY